MAKRCFGEAAQCRNQTWENVRYFDERAPEILGAGSRSRPDLVLALGNKIIEVKNITSWSASDGLQFQNRVLAILNSAPQLDRRDLDAVKALLESRLGYFVRGAPMPIRHLQRMEGALERRQSIKTRVLEARPHELAHFALVTRSSDDEFGRLCTMFSTKLA